MSTQTANSKLGNVIRVSSGNFLEMYDFMVYAYYASYIAREIFPSSNAYASLMMTLGTFGAGYLMRPLGAVVLGAYVDRHGRRSGLILTLFLMAIGTLVIACTPAYRTIGIVAPIVVVLGRLLQGFSAGVGVGGASVYLSEMATPGHRGFYCAWQSASQQVAVVFAALLGVALSVAVPPAGMAQWGWRVPFFIGCLIVPLLFWLRRSLDGDGSVSRAKASSRNFGSTCLARDQLENRRHRRIAFHHDDGEFLSHHRVHADVRHRSVAPDEPAKPDGHVLRGPVEFFLAADGRRDLRQGRKAAAADSDYGRRDRDCLSRDAVARERSIDRAPADRGIVAVHVLRRVQRGDDPAPGGNHAAGDSHLRLFLGV